MLPNLADLQKKCEALGLKVVQKGKRPAKDDYVQALRAHFLPAGGLPYEEIDPMLCFAEWNLKDSERELVWKSVNWAAQRKLNGCRAIIHFVKGKGTFIHSRNVTVTTFRMQELQEQTLIKDFIPEFTASLDCELLIEKPIDTRPYTAKGQITKTSLHSTSAVMALEPSNARKLQVEQGAPLMFHVFDAMRVVTKEGQEIDLRKLPLIDRLLWITKIMDKVATTEIAKYFKMVELEVQNKKAYFEKIVAEGGEGVILKNLRAPYEDSSSRSREGWVKCKRRQEYDAFVTGFKRGEEGSAWRNLVGAIEFGIYLEDGTVHKLGWASNITLENRQKISSYDAGTDTVTMTKGMYGKVAEISGQDISGRELRLTHCTIDRWRDKGGPDGKTAEQCVTTMESLKAASEWVGS